MTAPMLSSSRFSARAVTVFARLARVDLEHLARHGLLEAVDAGDSVLHFEDGTDFLDVELVEVGGFDLAEENVLDLAGAERGFGCHTVGRNERVRGLACENYHKLWREATGGRERLDAVLGRLAAILSAGRP